MLVVSTDVVEPLTCKLPFTMTSAVAPSIVSAVVSTPPSFTLNLMSPFDVAFLSVTSEPDTEMLKSESTPTVKPVSFSTPKVAEVVSFASDLKNDALSILSNVSALVAVPCILYPVARLSPKPIDVEPNPEGAVLAVNAVVEPIANLVPLLY